MTDTLELKYVCVNQTDAEIHGLMKIGEWCVKHLEPNSYGFDLRDNTWKFSTAENLTWFILVWATK